MTTDPAHAGAMVSAAPSARALTDQALNQLAEAPPALTSFANIDNPQTRRAYRNDVEEFMTFADLVDARAFRDVGRAHVLAWRRDLE